MSRHASELTELPCVGFVCFTVTRKPVFWWQVPRPQGYSIVRGGQCFGPQLKVTSAPDRWCQWLTNSDTNLLC